MATTRGSVTAPDRGTPARARRGDREAFTTLYERHAPAAWRLALVIDRDPTVAARAVIGAFARVLGTAPREVDEPTVRAQLLQATRVAAIVATPAPSEVAVARLEPLGARGDAAIDAFEQLPERWRTALWLRDIEGLDISEVGAVLGMTTASTVPLAERAFDGLREQFTQIQVRTTTQPDCARIATRLIGYVADALSERDEVRVRRHLDRCEACRARLDELDDLAPRLRRSVDALPAVVAGFAADAWLARTKGPPGRLALRLSGGQPLPTWAERSLAGATAAVVSLGITAAVLLGGRGDSVDPAGPLVAADQPVGPGDGQSALGGDGELTDEAVTGGGTDQAEPPTSPSTTEPPAPVSTPPASVPTPTAAPLQGAVPTPTAAPLQGAVPPPALEPPAPTTPIAPPPSTPPPSPPPTTPPPDDDLLGVVDDVVAVVDDLCTGLGLCSAAGTEGTLPPLLGR